MWMPKWKFAIAMASEAARSENGSVPAMGGLA